MTQTASPGGRRAAGLRRLLVLGAAAALLAFGAWYGWRWYVRPFAATLKRDRPPSRFWILVGKFKP